MKTELEICLDKLSITAENIIDLSLDRVKKIKSLLNLNIKCPLIIVGGTNGKGSTCTFLSHIYKESGFKVGTFTSPHLLQYNERICINTTPVNDSEIIAAFENIGMVKTDIKLTFFEISLMAAVYIFLKEKVDLIILEVGLGGRLDAVNIYDADVSIITNVDLDHQDYLGNNREQIAFEKAGILRKGKFIIFGERNPPKSLLEHVNNIQAKLLLYERDFHFDKNHLQWSFIFSVQDKPLAKRSFYALPIPSLRGTYQLQNASCALAAIEVLNQQFEQLNIDIGSIKKGLLNAVIMGRFQILPGRPIIVLDVAHNVHAALELSRNLIKLPFAKKKIAIFSVLKDKDINGILECLKLQFDEWFIATLDHHRSISIDTLIVKFKKSNINSYKVFSSIQDAFNYAKVIMTEEDRLTVFGSFYTVATILSIL